VGTERVRARRERLMFEAERVLMSDHVIIPLYTYVTKRLVSPQLKGWKNNVMDHHQTRHMYKLRWQSDAPAAADNTVPEEQTAPGPVVPGATGVETGAEDTAGQDS
jgi:hypothetical protein